MRPTRPAEAWAPPVSSRPTRGVEPHSFDEVELLPLPEVEVPAPCSSGARSMRQRHARRRAVALRVNEMVSALNEMAGCGSCAPGAHPTAAQASALEHLRNTCVSLAPGDDVPWAQEAFQTLRGPSSPSYGLPTNLASYQKDRLSLPAASTKPVSLATLLPGEDRCLVANFEQTCFRPDTEVEKLNREYGEIVPYMDPALKGSWRLYSEFLRRLHAAGMIRWALERKERATPFFVQKKNGMQRLIIDARRFNRRSSPPPKAPLGTVSALADIRLDDTEVLSFAASGIQDCFHQLELPASLQAYFGLDPLPAKLLSVRRIGSTSVSGDTLIYPLVRTAPMGCMWSIYWCQRAHEHCLDSAALLRGASSCLGAAARVPDRTPLPGWGAGAGPRATSTSSPPAATRCVNLVYADNN